jgi:hypothetical protein
MAGTVGTRIAETIVAARAARDRIRRNRIGVLKAS